jgi:hypothetical protein
MIIDMIIKAWSWKKVSCSMMGRLCLVVLGLVMLSLLVTMKVLKP